MSTVPAAEPEVTRTRAVRWVLCVVLALNLLVAGAKLCMGWASDSIAMVADGFHSLTDGASNVVGLVAIALAARPPDETHPYGHHKFETLAALFIGGLLALTAWEVLQSCFARLKAGGAPQATALSFAVMGVTVLVNLGVTTYESRRARRLGSELLAADAAHTRSDIYTSLSVIASLAAARAGVPQLDLVAALAITVLIGVAAFRILRGSAAGLADAALLPAQRIGEIALSVPGVRSVHKIRTRGLPGAGHADLHIQVDPSLRLDQAHVISHLVTERLRQELGLRDVLAHVEPPAGHRTDWRPASADAAGEEDER